MVRVADGVHIRKLLKNWNWVYTQPKKEYEKDNNNNFVLITKVDIDLLICTNLYILNLNENNLVKIGGSFSRNLSLN